jgi:hypothetical protein
LCSYLDRAEEIVFLKHGTSDKVLHPPSITLPRYVIKGVIGKHVPCFEFYPRKSLILESKGRLNTLKRSLLCQYFNLPLRNYQSSSRFLLIPSHTSYCEDIQGNQPTYSLSQSIEPFIFHDPFLKWIEHFTKGVNLHDFFPPSRLHELDFTIYDDTIHFPTHVIFVLD